MIEILDIELNKQDFKKSGIEEFLATVIDKKSHELIKEFYSKSKRAEENRNEKNQTIYSLFWVLCRIFDEKKVNNDFFENLINELSSNHLTFFEDIVSYIQHNDLAAITNEILWKTKKDYRFAVRAVNFYLQSAILHEDPENWTYTYDSIEFAFDLASTLGRNTSTFDDVYNHITTSLDKYNGKDRNFFSVNLMELLLKSKKDIEKKYLTLSEEAGKEAEKNHDFRKAHDWWILLARLYRKYNDKKNERSSLINAAETYVKEAEDSITRKNPSYLRAVRFVEMGIEEYRQLGKTHQEVAQLHKKLLDYQAISSAEFARIEVDPQKSPDIFKKIKEQSDLLVSEIKSKNLLESLEFLGLKFPYPDYLKNKEEAQDHFDNAPVGFIIEKSVTTEKGKTTQKIKSGLDDKEKRLENFAFNLLTRQMEINVKFIAEPLRSEIYLNNRPQIRDIIPILEDSAFVPENRKFIFAKGLHAGLIGDYMTAVHLLTPQIENSIRYLLELNGLITSNLPDDLIQDEFNLNFLLYRDELNKIFDENIIFLLRGVLIERSGLNARNLIAHGLLNDGNLYSHFMAFIWWMVLWLVILGNKINNDSKNSS